MLLDLYLTIVFVLGFILVKVGFDKLDYVFNEDLLASYRFVPIFYLDDYFTNPTLTLGLDTA